MDDSVTAKRGAPVSLWLIGAGMVVFGLYKRSDLVAKAKERSHISAMFDDMVGHNSTQSEFHAADWPLWVVGIGVLLLAVALTVQLVRRP